MKDEKFTEALQKGLTQYESSKPCKRHGTVRRYTKNKGCVDCARESAAKQYMGKVGKIRKLSIQAHRDDVELVTEFAKQLLENRRCQK